MGSDFSSTKAMAANCHTKSESEHVHLNVLAAVSLTRDLLGRFQIVRGNFFGEESQVRFSILGNLGGEEIQQIASFFIASISTTGFYDNFFKCRS
jgi:hypothetical protein